MRNGRRADRLTGKAGEVPKRTMTDRFMELKPVAPIIVLFMFVISILAATLPNTNGNLAIWGLTAFVGFLFLRMAYPRAIFYSLWLLAIYGLSSVGMLFMNGLGLTGYQGIGVGLLLVVLAGYIVYQLIIEVKGIRDISEGPYVPLGLWTLCVVLFFLISVGANESLASWIRSGGSIFPYAGLEFLLVLLVIYIFAKAELCVIYLEEGPKAARRRVPGPAITLPTEAEKVFRTAKKVATKTRKAMTPGKAAASTKILDMCPLCGSDLRMVARSCPSCDASESTAVCKKAGHVFLPCPSCGRANSISDYRCKKCNSRLTETLLCRKCGKEAELREWRLSSKPDQAGDKEGEGQGEGTGTSA